ncbi:MAG: hypothetical protein M1823_002138 [Watsoniomyces obsoletus]|nr:MAG: hypothetical protein M1823_002138 [Watsoniomyces obsoletus]
MPRVDRKQKGQELMIARFEAQQPDVQEYLLLRQDLNEVALVQLRSNTKSQHARAVRTFETFMEKVMKQESTRYVTRTADLRAKKTPSVAGACGCEARQKLEHWTPEDWAQVR